MSAWLEPLRLALDAARAPVTFFFRDDDGGWDDPGLLRLLDGFASARVPIDVAVIPKALEADLARELVVRAQDGLVGLHQHGFAHANHEPDGRKCEFGARRSLVDQRRDIADGRDRLQDLLGPAVDPIFTPPWNRCLPETAHILEMLGFTVLSRDSTATPLVHARIRELSITVDWFAHRKGTRLTREELGERLAEAARSGRPVGVMLHHAVMDAEERDGVGELLALVGQAPAARCVPMRVAAEAVGLAADALHSRWTEPTVDGRPASVHE